MSRGQHTGWRSLATVRPLVKQPLTDEKTALFEAGRLCARALNLSPNCRYVLEQLIGFYGGELVEGRMLVWPSNEILVERTGIPERSVRYALRQLIDLGVIVSKDSPNGKRFAQRSPQGQIIRAFGFDLGPILHRAGEWRERVQAQKDREREWKEAFDEMTVHRRSAQEALRAIAEWFPDTDISDLVRRALELSRRTPRRSAKGCAVEPFKSEWKAIREEAEAIYYAACGGNNCRHKDHNKDAPEESCWNGREDSVGEAAPPQLHVNAADLARACPDAMEFIGEARSDRELVSAVAKMRGAFGVSPSGWEEACRDIGSLLAAATLVYVVQLQAAPAPGADPIRNAGGYFRALVRLMKEGRVNLVTEIQRLMRRRL